MIDNWIPVAYVLIDEGFLEDTAIDDVDPNDLSFEHIASAYHGYCQQRGGNQHPFGTTPMYPGQLPDVMQRAIDSYNEMIAKADEPQPVKAKPVKAPTVEKTVVKAPAVEKTVVKAPAVEKTVVKAVIPVAKKKKAQSAKAATKKKAQPAKAAAKKT